MAPGWLAFTTPSPAAALRLFCFPFAGGGATAYRSWGTHLPASIQLCPVELPGRGTRMTEPRHTRVETVVEALVEGLTPYLDRPFAFFGHSMGALLSFELTRALRRRGGPLPVALLLSAHRAPHLPAPERDTYLLPDDALQAKLRRLEGTPAQLLEHPELMAFVLPIIRDDFSICDTYEYQPEEPLPCPFYLYGGVRDARVSQAELAPWRIHTTASFSLQMFPGGHFFIQDHPPSFLALLAEALAHEGALSGF